MKLTSIEVKNFKRGDHVSFTPGGNNATVVALNECFKSSLYDSYMWALFNKDSQGVQDFDIIPHDIKGAEPEVTLNLNHDGLNLTLSKKLKEVWKSRGRATPKFDGYKASYQIGVDDVKATEYTQLIKEIIDFDLFKLLSDPRYFSEVLTWDKRRAEIVKIFGGEDFDLEGMQRTKKSKQARNLEIEKELIRIRALLDNADSQGSDILEPKANIPELKSQLRKLNEERASISSGGAVAQLNVDISAVNVELEKIELDFRNKQTSGNGNSAKISELDKQLSDVIIDEANSRAKLMGLQAKLIDATDRHTRLTTEYKTRKAEVFGKICPRCNREMPAEQEKAFNESKSEDLAVIVGKGKEASQEKEDIQGSIDSIHNDIQAIENRKAELTTEINALRDTKPDPKAPKLEDLAEYQDAMSRKKALEEQRAKAVDNIQSLLDAKDQEITAKETEINVAQQVQVTWDVYQNSKSNNDDLVKSEKSLVVEHADNKDAIISIEKRIEAGLKQMERSVNDNFKTVSFRLFKTLKNGEIDQCCDLVSKIGVPYGSMSNSQKIRAGLEFILFASKHYGISVPVWIDNAESADHLIDMGDTQLIQLVVPFIDPGIGAKEASNLFEKYSHLNFIIEG